MKKFLKKLSFAVALVLCFTLAIPTMAQFRVFADEVPSAETPDPGYVAESLTSYIQIPGFKSTSVLGDDYEVAQGKLVDFAGAEVENSKVTVVVTDQHGHKVYDSVGGEQTFAPTKTGVYTFTYTATVDETTVATAVCYATIKGQTDDFGLAFKTNEAKESLLPSEVKKGTEVTLPQAIILQDDEIYTEDDLSVEVTTSKGTIANGKITFADAGVYRIGYTLKNTNEVVLAYKEFEVVASEDCEYPDFDFSFSETKVLNGEVGIEMKIPGITATAKNDNSTKVPVAYSVSITHKNVTYAIGETTKFHDVTILSQDEYGAYKFIPFETGKFVVNHTIKSINGTTKTSQYTIEVAKDQTAPKLEVTHPNALASTAPVNTYMVLPLSATDEATPFVDNNMTAYRLILKNGNTVFDEREYLKDLQESAPGEEWTLEKLNKRALVFAEGIPEDRPVVTSEGKTVTIKAEDQLVISTYGSQPFELEAGSYSIEYWAKDAQGLNAHQTYSFTLVSATEFNSATQNKPTVNFADESIIKASMLVDEKITIGEPTASQVKANASDEDPTSTVITFKDTRLTNYITYKTFDGESWSEPIFANENGSWLSYNKDKKQYTFSVKSNEFAKVKLIANSTNSNGKTSSVEKEIIIVKDTTPTTVTAVTETGNENYYTNSSIYLPKVEYTDADGVSAIFPQITVTNTENGNKYNISGLNAKTVGTVKTFNNAVFTPDVKGEYVIQYTTTDLGGNKTVLTFVVNVETNPGELNAYFTGLGSKLVDADVEVNTHITLPNIAVEVTDTTVLTPGAIDLQLVEGDYSAFNTNGGSEIWFTKAGTYKLQFTSTVTNSVTEDISLESEVYTITVVDTKAPTIQNVADIETAMAKIATISASDFATQDKTFELLLPVSDEDLSKATISIVTNKNPTPKVIKLDATSLQEYDFSDDNKSLKLKMADYLSADDVATVTYLIKDSANNETKMTYTIKVGNVTTSKIKIVDASKYLKASYTTTEATNFAIDLNMIDIRNAETGDALLKKVTDQATGNTTWQLTSGTLAITVKNVGTSTSTTITSTDSATPTSTQTSKTDLKFEKFNISTAGEYQIIITYTNDAGQQVSNSSLTFQVADQSSSSMSSEEVLGIVLIVISVIVLAGVVTYFVVTRKKYKTKK